MQRSKVLPQEDSPSQDNKHADTVEEKESVDISQKRVNILRRALLHGSTAASLTPHQLKLAADKCILTSIEKGEDIKTAMESAEKKKERGAEKEEKRENYRFKGLFVLEKITFSKMKSIQYFEDKFPKKLLPIPEEPKEGIELMQQTFSSKIKEATLLFIPCEVEKAIFGRFYNSRGEDKKADQNKGKIKPSSVCGKYDSISGRLRYWWAENKCYRYFVIWLGIHLILLATYHITALVMRNDMMESVKGYNKDADGGKGNLREFHDEVSDVHLKFSNLKCRVFLVSEKTEVTFGFNETRSFYANKKGLKYSIPLLEWPGICAETETFWKVDSKGPDDCMQYTSNRGGRPRGFAKNGFSYFLGTNLRLTKSNSAFTKYNGSPKEMLEVVQDTRKNETASTLDSQACTFYLFIDKTSHMNVTVHLGKDAEIDVQAYNFTGPLTQLHIFQTNPGEVSTSTGVIEKSVFSGVYINTHSTAIQIVDVKLNYLNIAAFKGWANVETLIDMDLHISNSTGKCLKGGSIVESIPDHYNIRTSVGANYVGQRGYGTIDIKTGMAYYSRKLAFAQELSEYELLFRTNSDKGRQYNISTSQATKVLRALDTIHPVLKLNQFDIRSPRLENVTYFASHAMVFRLRPVFLAIASAGLLMATKTNVQIVMEDSPCMSSYEVKMCALNANSTRDGHMLHCSTSKQFDTQNLAVYDDVQKYLRDAFFKPMENDVDKVWIQKAGYENYVFAAQKHTGEHMSDLMAWLYDINTDSFKRNMEIHPRLVGISLILLSSVVCFALLVIFGVVLILFLSNAEKEVITNTLFNDPEFLKDIAHTMHIAKTELRDFVGDDEGVEETDIFRLTFLCCKDRARCRCDKRCCSPNCDNPAMLRSCCAWTTDEAYYVAVGMSEESKWERRQQKDKKSFCYCFKRLCGLGYIRDRRPTRISDIADTQSEWFQGLRDLISEVPKSPSSKTDDKPVIHDGQMHWYSFRNAVSRLIKKAALVQSYTDLMFFVEMYFPNAEMSLAPTAEEVLYSEMDHSYIHLDFTVIFAQMMTAGILVLPSALFALLWSGLETYYYSELPNGVGKARDFYMKYTLPVPMPTPIIDSKYSGYAYGYLRLSFPSIIVAGIVFVYFFTEMYNFFDMYILHGTKYELGEYGHRLLEWRQICNEQLARANQFGDTSTFLLWKGIPFDCIRAPPPLEKGHSHCPCSTIGCTSCSVCFTWFFPFRACFCKCCRKGHKTFDVGDVVEVNLPGWDNYFVGIIKTAKTAEQNVEITETDNHACCSCLRDIEMDSTFTISFCNPNMAADIFVLFDYKERLKGDQVGKDELYDTGFEANIGDLVLIEISSTGPKTYSVGFYMGQDEKQMPQFQEITLKITLNEKKSMKDPETYFDLDAYKPYDHSTWFDEFFDVNDQTNRGPEDRKIVTGYHVYPIESWWDSKEVLKEYSDFVSVNARCLQ